MTLTVLALVPSSGVGHVLANDDSLSLAPQTATLSLGTQYTVTATTAEINDVDSVGHTVTITVTSGPDTGQQVTGQVGPAGGQVSLSYTNQRTPGTDQISASVVDNDGGPQTTATASVTWVDTTAPTVHVPADITVEATGPLGAIVKFAAIATDPDDTPGPVSCDHSSGDRFPIGTTNVTCSSTDTHGNTGTGSFDVTVTPGQGPPPPPSAPPPPPPPPPPFAPPPPPPPTIPGSVKAAPVAGKVEPQVKLPGTNEYVPLSQIQQLPPGTSVDVSQNAAIQLSDPSNNQMVFFGVPDGVPSVFTIAGKANGEVKLVLAGGNFRACRNRTLSSAGAKAKKPVRRLWGSGKGRFTTKGKFASATVRGTEWLVADYCNGTLVSVRKGLVSVRDLVQKKTKLVRAGHSYFAPSKAPSKTLKK